MEFFIAFRAFYYSASFNALKFLKNPLTNKIKFICKKIYLYTGTRVYIL